MAPIAWSDVVGYASQLSVTSPSAQTLILDYVNITLSVRIFGGEDVPKTKLARVLLACHLATLATPDRWHRDITRRGRAEAGVHDPADSDRLRPLLDAQWIRAVVLRHAQELAASAHAGGGMLTIRGAARWLLRNLRAVTKELGAALNDRVWREIRAKLGSLANRQVKVGWLDSGEMQEGSDLSLAEIAAIQEWGAPNANIPAREPLRRTFTEAEGREENARMCTRLARSLINDKIEVDQALGLLGAWGVSAVQRRIRMGLPPPLRPATVAAKGSSAPLIDTGQLIQGVTWAVI